jgi:gamma-glutamylcyclotransferase (GGCT)/AIG2-like uncharacterized protein YtfP
MRGPEHAERELLFVYGSLKRGQANHEQLAGAEFLGAAKTVPGYSLYRVGVYPGLARGGHAAVAGELYRVACTAFRRLDAFEGCPWLYERGRVQLADGRSVHTYLIPDCRRSECDPCLGGTWP